MKKIIQIFISLSLIAGQKANAQIWVPGDAVVTFSPRTNPNAVGSTPVAGSATVLAVYKTNNTSQAPVNAPWASTTPGRPANFITTYPDWTVQKLGYIFGVTHDEFGNIYVASTSVMQPPAAWNVPYYSAQAKIFRISASDGSIAKIYEFINNDSFSLGNLKYCKMGTKSIIYVPNWTDGKLYKLEGNPSTTAAWNQTDAFNPKFNDPAGDANFPAQRLGQLAWGVAVRTINGASRLFYSRFGTYGNNTPSVGNELWSVGLQTDGNFSNDEVMENINGVTSFPNPISDISFSGDQNKMLTAQRTMVSLHVTYAHNSEVLEYVNDNLNNINNHSWGSTAKFYYTYPSAGTPPGRARNSSGGVSYSNQVLLANASVTGCDSSVWATFDAICTVCNSNPPGSYQADGIYGFLGMRSNAPENHRGNSVSVDVDDNWNYDKSFIGDIEIYKTNINCTTCACGEFSNPTLNEHKVPEAGATNNESSKASHKLSFVKGNVSGVFHINYQCVGTCNATTEWSIVKQGMHDAGAQRSNSDDADIVIDLARHFNNLECGTYNLVIEPTCNGKKCDRFIMQVDIICEPPSCCVAKIEMGQPDITIRPDTDPNGRGSVLSGGIKFSSDLPMSEVRINVEEFRLSANSENCLLCKNPPNTWGNIISASLNDIPGLLFDGNPIPNPGRTVDYREAVFKKGQPINLNPGYLSFDLRLPSITDLECCEVTVYLCIKITYKDVNCRECVRMICDKYVLRKKPKGNNDNPKEKRNPVIFIPVN